MQEPPTAADYAWDAAQTAAARARSLETRVDELEKQQEHIIRAIEELAKRKCSCETKLGWP